MNAPDDPIRVPPLPIAYATPLVDGPRPGVAMWIAAGLVWAALVLVGCGVGFALLFIVHAGEVGAGLVALLILAALVGLAVVEWLAVARRSAISAGVVAILAGGFALLWLTLLSVQLFAAPAQYTQRDPRAMLWVTLSGIAFYVALPAFVAVTHGRWARRLRRPDASIARP